MDDYIAPKQKRTPYKRKTLDLGKEKELEKIKAKLDRALGALAKAEATGNKAKIGMKRRELLEVERELFAWQNM